MAERWYFEEAGPGGNWMPRTAPSRPVTKTVNGATRIKLGEGQGPRVRNITLVPEILRAATLDQLAEIMPKVA